MLNETEARVLHALGALLFHHSKFTSIPVSELLDMVILPTVENESPAKQVEMIQLILRGEAQAHQIDVQLNRCHNVMVHSTKDVN